MWFDLAYFLRTIRHLFAARWQPLALFWLATLQGLETPSPLAASVGLILVLRMIGNLLRMRQTGNAAPKLALVVFGSVPVLVLFVGDPILMVLWSAWTGIFGWVLWRWRDMRDVERTLRPAPIEDTELWMDVRAASHLATAGVGLLLSLTGDPALWITGYVLGAAAMELTALLYLRGRGWL